MSREFGEFLGGYFHNKISSAKEDLSEAHFEIHRKLIPFFETLYEISWEISSAEAGDSGVEDSKRALLKKIPILQAELKKLQMELAEENKESIK